MKFYKVHTVDVDNLSTDRANRELKLLTRN